MMQDTLRVDRHARERRRKQDIPTLLVLASFLFLVYVALARRAMAALGTPMEEFLALVVLAILFATAFFFLFGAFTPHWRVPVARTETGAAGDDSAHHDLQRRYVAGVLTHTEYRQGMIDVLRQRFAAGQLSLPAYERELDRLIERTRAVENLDDGDPGVIAPRKRA